MARSCMAHTHTQTHTRTGYAQDHVITHVLGAVAHSCEHSSCHAALHACGAEGRRSCRGGVAVTPPQSCWSAQLQAAASSRQSDSDSHTRHTGGITKQQRCGGADSRSPQRTPLTARRTAAADAGGKEARQTRGRERRQHGPDRQRGGKGGTAKLAARVWRRQPPVVSQRARCTRRSSPMRPRPRAGRRRRRLPLRAAAATHVVATMS